MAATASASRPPRAGAFAFRRWPRRAVPAPSTTGEGRARNDVAAETNASIASSRCPALSAAAASRTRSACRSAASASVGGATRFVGNAAKLAGGAVGARGRAAVALNGAAVEGNTARDGGGIGIQDAARAGVRAGWVRRNAAAARGGGVFAGGTAAAAVSFMSIGANTAERGGGVYAQRTAAVGFAESDPFARRVGYTSRAAWCDPTAAAGALRDRTARARVQPTSALIERGEGQSSASVPGDHRAASPAEEEDDPPIAYGMRCRQQELAVRAERKNDIENTFGVTLAAGEMAKPPQVLVKKVHAAGAAAAQGVHEGARLLLLAGTTVHHTSDCAQALRACAAERVVAVFVPTVEDSELMARTALPPCEDCGGFADVGCSQCRRLRCTLCAPPCRIGGHTCNPAPVEEEGRSVRIGVGSSVAIAAVAVYFFMVTPVVSGLLKRWDCITYFDSDNTSQRVAASD
eukprot:gene11288-20815_t